MNSLIAHSENYMDNLNTPQNNNLLFWISYFMAFPAFTIFGTQVGMLLLLIFFLYNNNYITNFKFDLSTLFSISFMAASIISVLDSNESKTDDLSLTVLPNYLMWGLTIMFLPHLLKRMNLYPVYKGISIGIITLLICNLFNDQIKSLLPFLRFPVDNGYAFMLISFAPITFYYLNSRNKIAFYLFAFIAVFSLIILERRAGFVIISAQFLLFHYIGKVSIKRIIQLTFITFLSVSILISGAFESFIFSNSNRLYSLLYEYNDTKLLDQSALTREAMVEKGLIIFSEHPLTGIGLNNFMNYDVEMPLEFEGGEILMNKDLSKKSAHNSYIVLLSGGGLLLFVPVVIFFVFIIIRLSKKITDKRELAKPIFLGFVGMCLHLYYISTIVNIFTWFFISTAYIVASHKELNYQKV